jgi:glycosyltransferase involved in cell wall biosynthesis
MTRITYIVSDLDGSIQMECTALGLKNMFVLNYILIGKPNTIFYNFLKLNGISVKLIDTAKHGFFSAWVLVLGMLVRNKPDIVHAHLWRATLIAMSASWLLRIPRRIFTRHHGTIHYTQYPFGRKWDRLCNFFATDIVAISENVRQILLNRDKASIKKVTVIRHGFDLKQFNDVSNERSLSLVRKYNIPLDGRNIGVISRYTEWKGVQYAIEAFEMVRQKVPNVHLILANATGDYQAEIKQKLNRLPVGSFTEIVFERDIAALYSIFEVFVHIPVDAEAEAFGQTYIEALACRRPSVFTMSGIASEFIEDEQNALVVPYRNAEQTAQAIMRLLNDRELAARIINGASTTILPFHIANMIGNLQALYA